MKYLQSKNQKDLKKCYKNKNYWRTKIIVKANKKFKNPGDVREKNKVYTRQNPKPVK